MAEVGVLAVPPGNDEGRFRLSIEAKTIIRARESLA